ncbi:carbohydrate kinase family protein [Fervidobacterium gondwanense]|uniref:carbohydrate kinase family protein n=1 Tax=Fervidobacterium gondwanense TaxID=44754 RepID=UPI003C751AAF
MNPLTVSCVGKVNVDIFYSVDEIKINNNHVSDSTAFSLGGKAANVSVALRKLGIQTNLVSAIGDDEFGDFVLSKLRDYGVSPLVSRKSGTKTGFTFIVVDRYGNNTMFNYLGANALLTVEDLQIYEADLLSSEIIFYQSGLGPELLVYLKRLKRKVFVEYTEPLPSELLAGVEFVSLNEEEALRVTNTQAVDDAINSLLSLGIRNVFIKLGSKGSLYVSKTKRVFSDAYKVNVIDTTGAGDSFSAGCIYGILNNFSEEETLRFANKCGAITCTRKGTTEAFPTLSEVLDVE